MNILNSRGVAVLMLLFALPLLMAVLKIAMELTQQVQQKQTMREKCFTVALHGLQMSDVEKATQTLAAVLPDSAVSVIEDPKGETVPAFFAPKRLVFNLKNKKEDFNCGAEAKWKNETWVYEIVLDKF